ncbi:hypothetical protein B7486_09595 [cyanobacterium TDX16]|nr:hypothetical protein B7486_09595 [cyanobacterium TDX16]
MTRRARAKPRSDLVSAAPARGILGPVRTFAAAIGICTVTLLAYFNSFDVKFVFDDEAGIVDNELIRRVLPIERFFQSTQPLTDLTFALNYASDGLTPGGFHGVNLAIHCLAALLLFGLVRRTIVLPGVSERLRDSADGLALAAAVLWSVHPLQTESVTYLVQRSESLMGLFYLLTLYAALRAATSGTRWAWNLTAILACAAAMASKSVAVTAPFVVLLYDRAFLFENWKAVFHGRWKLYAGLAATYLVPLGLGVFHGLLFESSETATVGFGFKGITPIEYLKTQPGVILHYLTLIVWPIGQCLDYAWPVAKSSSEILLPSIIVGLLAALGIACFFRRRAVGFLICSMFLILLPTSSIVPLKDPAFEHRMYLPLAPALVALVMLIHAVRLPSQRGGSPATTRRWSWRPYAAAITCFVLIMLTRERNALYAEPKRLWADVAAKAPQNPRAYNALGFIELGNGAHDAAIELFRQAIRQDSDYAPAYVNLGKAYYRKRDMESAVREFRIALHVSPSSLNAEAHLLFGTALAETDRSEEAIEQLKLAISKNPRLEQAYFVLADRLWKLGRRDSAVGVFQQALATEPGLVEARVNMGLVLSELGRTDEAVSSLESALRYSKPSTNPETVIRAHYNLGLVLVQAGRQREAVPHLRRVLSLNPKHHSAAKLLQQIAPDPPAAPDAGTGS